MTRRGVVVCGIGLGLIATLGFLGPFLDSHYHPAMIGAGILLVTATIFISGHFISPRLGLVTGGALPVVALIIAPYSIYAAYLAGAPGDFPDNGEGVHAYIWGGLAYVSMAMVAAAGFGALIGWTAARASERWSSAHSAESTGETHA